VRAFIRDGEAIGALQEAMIEGSYYGMQLFDQDLAEKVRSGVIDEHAALGLAMNPQDFKLMLAGSLVTRSSAGEGAMAFIEGEDEHSS